MPEPRVPAVAADLFRDDCVGAPQQVEPRLRDLTEDADRESGPREWLANDELFIQPELPADLADLVLEEFAQRFDELHPHAFRQAAHVVMALDECGLPNHGDRLNHIRVERPLREEVDLAQLVRFRLEHVDERGADDLALLLGIRDALQGPQELRRGVHPDHLQVEGREVNRI